MFGMFKKSKGADFSPAIAAAQRGTRQAVDALNEAKRFTPTNFKSNNAFGSTSAIFNPNTRRVETSTNSNPLLTGLFETSLRGLNNFEGTVQPRVQRFLDVNRKANTDSIASVLGNILGNTGVGGSKNSTFTDAYGSFAAKSADNLARAELDAENTIRGQAMGELQTQYNSALNPLQFQASEASGLGGQAANSARGLADIQGQIANAYTGQGQTLSGIYGQKALSDQQAKQQSNQALAGLIGGVINLGSKFIPMPGGAK